ncbi:MAG TPA: beta-ketoacyl synthase N-terminal-like domain-containing protein [Anaerolineae bacterium]|nr:beta-ketoacyl synthase N-terminal-like domain-containing protein [Anaerolineae bacterium]
MREVAIIGVGQTPVAEHWDKSLVDLASEAIRAALNDAGLDRADALYAGNMMSGTVSRQSTPGALIAGRARLGVAESIKVDTACSSGASALRLGLSAVASGEIGVAVVAGVEKMTDAVGGEVTAALASAADADFEAAMGTSFVAINALLMRRYMEVHGWKHADFAPFSINAHANARHNPYARLRNPIDEKQHSRARMVADPINLLDVSPTGDGAAAAVIVPVERAGKYRSGGPLVTIAASAAATDSIALHDRYDTLELAAARQSAERAYAQAGLSPADVDVFELHDAFSIMAALSLEAAGFAEPGQGPRLGLDDQIGPRSKVPIATMGGLKARGHPVGATGMYQIVELYLQLTGRAGETQVPGAKIGMAQNIGGSGASVVTHILRAG